MNNVIISDSIKYIGVDDTTLDLFESQYIVPNGVSYNSYLILDEKIAVMDTVDARKTKEWFDNLDKELKEHVPDYLIVSHLEPDHSANIQLFTEKYKEAKLVLSAKAKAMLPQFFNIEGLDERCIVVKEGEELDLGNHHLKFIMAPMVHWPEVMVEYETTEKILFSDCCENKQQNRIADVFLQCDFVLQIVYYYSGFSSCKVKLNVYFWLRRSTTTSTVSPTLHLLIAEVNDSALSMLSPLKETIRSPA